MSRLKTEDTNVTGFVPLVSPKEVKQRHPASDRALQHVFESRQAIRRVLHGQDPRLLVIVGPCSIHDPQQALEYGSQLQELAEKVQEQFLLIMRVYFEKPRTQKGWRGLLIDPHLDGSYDIAHGLSLARGLLLQLCEQGIPTATEVLDPIVPHYIADLICWAAIGARTTESQIHRELSSGLSMPVGFKNSTDGSFHNSINAMHVALGPHKFIGINNLGQISLVSTQGNQDVHLILRGGHQGPNYHAKEIAHACEILQAQHFPPAVIVDCSHANSNKDFRRQPEVFDDVLQQHLAGQRGIRGLMLESHLNEGQQKLTSDLSLLKWGVSLTDGCIGWQQTEDVLLKAADALAHRPRFL